MPEPKAAQQSNPQHHVAALKEKLKEVADHARQDSAKVSDPRAQALFETTAEVLYALNRACDDMQKKNEPAWR